MIIEIDFKNCLTSNQVLKQVYLKINELDTSIKVDVSHTDEKYGYMWDSIMGIEDDIFGVLSDVKSNTISGLQFNFKNINTFKESNPKDFIKFIDLFDWLKEDLKNSSNIDFTYEIKS